MTTLMNLLSSPTNTEYFVLRILTSAFLAMFVLVVLTICSISRVHTFLKKGTRFGQFSIVYNDNGKSSIKSGTFVVHNYNAELLTEFLDKYIADKWGITTFAYISITVF